MLTTKPIDYKKLLKIYASVNTSDKVTDYFKTFKIIRSYMDDEYKKLIDNSLTCDDQVPEFLSIDNDTELVDLIYTFFFCKLQSDLCEHWGTERLYEEYDEVKHQELAIYESMKLVWEDMLTVVDRYILLHIWLFRAKHFDSSCSVAILPNIGMCLISSEE